MFSDSPQPNVKTDTVDINSTPNIVSSVDTAILENKPPSAEETQLKVQIIKPSNEQTIRDNSGSVYISGVVKPSFKRGLSVVLKMDDKKVKGPQTSAVFILRNVDRGAHKVQLEVWNSSGKVIAVSDPVTFFLHRGSVN